MSEKTITRKLVAIFYADVVGYSRLTFADEEGTHQRVMETLDFVTKMITEAGGKVLRYAGDAVLAEFSSVVIAIKASLDIQSKLDKQNSPYPVDEKVQIRIGVNLGDVIYDRGELYGDAVNIAARMEAGAEPGGICISASVYEQISGKISTAFEDCGEEIFKNIATPVHVYRWLPGLFGGRDRQSKMPLQANKQGLKTGLHFPDRPSIAILPFINMSADPEQVFFSDGITEDIITDLSRYGSLFVIARNSSFVFRDISVDLREVGRTLRVRYVLEGSVRKVGNRIRVTAQLIDAEAGNHIWADRYDGDLADVFELQDDISRTIVATIAGRLKDIHAERSVIKATDSLSAYENLLRGQKLMHHYTQEDYAKARKFFERAISLDPKFARAHAWLAALETYDWFWEMIPDGLDHAVRIGQTSLALDSNGSKCHLALGVALLFRSEHEKAYYHLSKASSLNPNDDLIMVENGRYLMYSGEPLAGTTHIRQAMLRNPYHPNWYWNILGRCFHTAKAYDKAITYFERITTPQFWNHAYLAACYASLGQSTRAAKHVNEVLLLKPDFTISNFATALPYRDNNDLNEFLEGLRRADLPA